MMIDVATLRENLAPFADLGTSAPQIVQVDANLVCRLFREGRQIELVFGENGAIRERFEGTEKLHANFKALLASTSFANLRRWADSQRIFLHERVAEETIQLTGTISSGGFSGGLDLFDKSLLAEDSADTNRRVLVMLVDGPAGIGKTSIIRSLSYTRAASYALTQRPLVLHVESRGRVLQNINDLMAFSLQTLRLNVTYDQIPVLVRNGLITLAVDGFDELGDPNGYELAWAQVNDLIVASRGAGVLILSGRETFISRSRMEFALSAIDPKFDQIDTYTLEAIRPGTARSWLLEKGWTEDQIEADAARPLFEEGSYALKPFFLSELAREGVAEQVCDGIISDLLSFLVEAMMSRESKKFGIDVDSVTSKTARIDFIDTLMREIARDLAENQTDAIPDESVGWLAEIVAHGLVPQELIGILKNRAGVIAFLTADDRRGYKRFLHEQIQNHFLAHVTIEAVVSGELPKYIRRNILGAEFLENFCDAFRKSPQARVDVFIQTVQTQLKSSGELDRSKRNLAALLFSACSVSQPSKRPIISDLSLEEIYCTETVAPLKLSKCSINQLYARDADLRKIEIDEECYIISMIANNGTLLSTYFPIPNVINTPDKSISAPDEKFTWAISHGYLDLKSADSSDAYRLPSHPLFELLTRIARYKPFWLKVGDERGARRIFDDPQWETLKPLLVKHGFLIERQDLPASGRPGSFFHIKNRQALMRVDEMPTDLLGDIYDAAVESEDPIEFN